MTFNIIILSLIIIKKIKIYIIKLQIVIYERGVNFIKRCLFNNNKQSFFKLNLEMQKYRDKESISYYFRFKQHLRHRLECEDMGKIHSDYFTGFLSYKLQLSLIIFCNILVTFEYIFILRYISIHLLADCCWSFKIIIIVKL